MTSDWLTVSQDMIDAFAGLTGDTQWIHLDRDRAARESPYGATVAHGFLTLSLISRLVREAAGHQGIHRVAVNYGFNRVRFPAPVRAGSRVRARILAQTEKPIEGGREVLWTVHIEVDGSEKPAVAAEWIVRQYD